MAKHFGEHIAEAILQAGVSYEKGVGPEDVRPDELQEGVHVEMEHTDDPALSMKIALDHLAEGEGPGYDYDRYYTGLSILEQIMETNQMDELVAWAENELDIKPKLRTVPAPLRRKLGIMS